MSTVLKTTVGRPRREFHQELLSGSSFDMREAPWSSGRALALDAARPRSIPGLGGENY